MSELTLTLLRLGLLVALWLFVFGVLSTLRRDLSTGLRVSRQALSPAVPRSSREPFTLRRETGAQLVITRADGSSHSIPLGDVDITIGHADDNVLVLADEYTSSHHARISKRDRSWVIEDCGSTNGTWVDRKRISGTTAMNPGVRVRVGKTEIAIRP